MGQMENILTERQQCSLPSNSKKNMRGEGKEHVKAITLRSVRELAIEGQPLVVREEEIEVVDQLCDAPNSAHGVKRGCHFFSCLL